MPDQTTPLDTALGEVIEFARNHGVDTARLTPADFGHQLTEAGLTHVTYVDADHVISAHIDRYGHARPAVGVVEWVHDANDEERDLCDYCEVIGPEVFGLAPAITLPPSAALIKAYRGDDGNIQYALDNAFIADGDITREQFEACLARFEGDDRDYAAEMRARYRAALALLDQEAAANA